MAARLCDSSLCGSCTFEHVIHSLSVFFSKLFLGCDWELGCHCHLTSFSQFRTCFCVCKPEQLFLHALCYVYQYRNWFASQYHKSLLHLSTAFKFPGKKIVWPGKTWYAEKTLSGNCSLLVPFVSSLLGRLCLGTWRSPSDVLHWESCPALGPYLSITPLSVTEHSLVSHDSTASLKGFDEGPWQISSGNTNRLYQLKLT